jgi:hypothetical protein
MSNFFEPLVIDGVLYYSDYPILNSNAASWNAVDLRTGQTLWSELPGTQATIPGASTAEKLRMGQTVKFHSMQEYGSFSLLYSTGGANSSFKLYEPFSGEYVGNITNTVSSSYIMDENPNDQNVGSIFGYYVANGNLTFWN